MVFLSTLRVEEVDEDHRRWRLLEPLRYQGNKEIFEIPTGFITDFASVPKVFWSLISPWSRQLKPAIVHDYLYVTGQVSRKDADGLFYRQMRELGVPWLKRKIIYRAVRMFGGKGYRH